MFRTCEEFEKACDDEFENEVEPRQRRSRGRPSPSNPPNPPNPPMPSRPISCAEFLEFVQSELERDTCPKALARWALRDAGAD